MLTSRIQCYCGSSLPSFDSVLDPSKCSIQCGGYTRQSCGGPSEYSIYTAD
jgi:cell wall integrity and stress response component